MSNVIEQIRDKAKQDPKRILFPEAADERIQQAVEYVEREGIAKPELLSPDKHDPARQEEFVQDYFERKRAKGLTQEQARQLAADSLYYAAMACRAGLADGFVAGAQFTTSAVARAAIRCLTRDQAVGLVSSCFIMNIPNCAYGAAGTLIYADCGVNPYPDSDQLASIAISTARFAKEVLGIEPRVALLSFATKGSAKGKWIERVREAAVIAKSKDNALLIDGELQADAALVPEVAKRKLKESPVAGQANVLIFPSLDAGNISYKLTERLAQARAVGPIVLGTVEPCSDLSRGCGVEDIIDCTAVTVVRAQMREKQGVKT